ncbi:activator of 90 kDa heat shock protein ATPase homolog 1-like [Dysidea avara]|uniref:activator of 90 kDa heat shock protein ATPase homolog 1-like n=1 Tax=Dysidea avara TaxID=196820 RepID=UPI00331E027C
MAKWGQGDPRWIVEERADATNVNNWHWTERNATSWSKSLLESLLVDLVFDGKEGTCKTVKVTEITGEASANNRKGKLFFFYEFVIKLKWSGHSLDNQEDKCTGTMEIVNLSDENDLDSIDVIVETKKTTSEAYALKSLVLREGVPVVKEQLGVYLKKLKEEFSQGMVLPRQNSSNNPPEKVVTATQPQQVSTTVTTNGVKKSGQANSSNHGYRIHTKKLSLTEDFKTTAEDLYYTLTNIERVKAFTDSTVILEPFKGGKFQMFGGNIEGEFLQLERNKKIVQRWRSKGWPEGHFSTVTIEILELDDHTQLRLVQTEVPDDQLERTQQGWRRHYFECMKNTFGYGSRLL